MQTGQYSTSQFARDVDTYVRKYPNQPEVLRQVKPLLEKLIKSPGSVPAGAFTPRKDRFAMTLIHMPSDELFSIIGGVWHPGQTTPIHNHLAWALIGVYHGEEARSTVPQNRRWIKSQNREDREGQRKDQHKRTRNRSRSPWHPQSRQYISGNPTTSF